MARPALAFDKYEGLGNDFLVVDAVSEGLVDVERAVALCDRHFGVGADGVLLVLPATSPGAVARMKVINADGSVPEMCGNGLRCVALHVARKQGTDARTSEVELLLDTDAGPRRCLVLDGATPTMTIDMGAVAVGADEALDIAGETLTVTPADAGNPHAVSFAPVSAAEFTRVGPLVSTNRAFAHGANAEFAVVNRDGTIDLAVWERGAGPTLACGTGACATVAVACAKGLVPYEAPITVRLPGGALEIRIVRETAHAIMRGPARHVFAGTTTL